MKGQENVLSDREASDAIAVMREGKEKRPGQPWFAQVRTTHIDNCNVLLYVTSVFTNRK